MSGQIDGDLFTGRITDDVINLCIGAPGPETLKKSSDLFYSAARHRLEKFGAGDVSLFQYGPECGSAEFLRQLADFLTKEYNDKVPTQLDFVSSWVPTMLDIHISCHLAHLK